MSSTTNEKPPMNIGNSVSPIQGSVTPQLRPNQHQASSEAVSPQGTGVPDLHDQVISPQSTGISSTQQQDSSKPLVAAQTVDNTPILTDRPLEPSPTYEQGIEVVVPEHQGQPTSHAPMSSDQKHEPSSEPYIGGYDGNINGGGQNGGGPNLTPAGVPRNSYATAMPLRSLQQGPTPVDCPVCGVREVTAVEFVSGNYTHGTAALCCFCLCLGCIPYMASAFKDVEHKCGNCGSLLAVWHRSGRTEVVAPGAPGATRAA